MIRYSNICQFNYCLALVIWYHLLSFVNWNRNFSARHIRYHGAKCSAIWIIFFCSTILEMCSSFMPLINTVESENLPQIFVYVERWNGVVERNKKWLYSTSLPPESSYVTCKTCGTTPKHVCMRFHARSLYNYITG